MAKKKSKTATRRQRRKGGARGRSPEPRARKRSPEPRAPSPELRKKKPKAATRKTLPVATKRPAARPKKRKPSASVARGSGLGARGSLHQKRSRAARAGWKTRRAREAEEARKLEERRARRAAKNAEKRTERERQKAKERAEREAAAKELADKEHAAEREKQQKRHDKEAERRRKLRLGRPSDALIALFNNAAEFYHAGYFIFDDGVEEGQIMVAGGKDPVLALHNLERRTAPSIEPEPVWVQVGVRARNAGGKHVRVPDPNDRSLPDSPKRKDMENYTGYVEEWSKPHHARKARMAFLVGRVIAQNMVEFGDRVEFVMVRVTFGPKPE